MQKQIVARARVDDSFLPDNIHPVLKQIYASRGITDSTELNTTVASLHNYQSFGGMKAAVALLLKALSADKHIVIVGDFDADGATSTAVMILGLKMLGFRRVEFLVPNRFDFGYGLSPEMAELTVAQGAELIITVDNGISSIKGVEVAKKAGVEVLITDHHLPAEQLPNADAIINPNQLGCDFPSKHLAGVGVAFYLLLALRSEMRNQGYFADNKGPNIAQLLDLVALGTVADVVPLDANNRILVHQGLQRVRSGHCRPGIKAMIEVAKKDQSKLVASDFGFALGPRLNAAGRLDDMSLGISCLLTDDHNQAKHIAQQLDMLNKDRRDIEQGMQNEAQKVLNGLTMEGQIPDAICLYQADWHEGVIGIVAGRIKEQYHRPTAVFAQTANGELKGSARSIAGLHIRDIFEQLSGQHPELIKKFGGHAMAAGLTIGHSQYAAFKSAFESLIADIITEEQRTCTILTDGELPPELMNIEFAQLLKTSGPWGQAFPEPVFEGRFRLVSQRLVAQKHLKVMLQHPSGMALDGIYFNCDLSLWPNGALTHVQVAYTLDINEFRGQVSVQLLIKELLPFKP